jgi:glycosyltransferase involved in cell wall biosynthesis
VKGARRFCQDVLVVDDGSNDDTAEQARKAGATVLSHARNEGKGTALNTGFLHARAQAFDYVITMAGSGQHAPEDIPLFVEAYVRTGIPVLIGNRMSEARSIPFVRRVTNYALTWMLNRKMGWYVPDSQCGFRLYRTDVIPYVAARESRCAVDSEMLLHVAARGIRMDAVPVQVIYGRDVRPLSPLRDAFRFLRMLYDYDRTYGGTRRGQSTAW